MFWGNGSESIDTIGTRADYFAILLIQIRDSMQNYDNKGSPQLKKNGIAPLMKKKIILSDSYPARILPIPTQQLPSGSFPWSKNVPYKLLIEESINLKKIYYKLWW